MIKSIEETNGWVNVQLEGDVYVKDATMLREKLISYIEAGKVQFHFDFSHVSFIDSAGLGVLVAIHKKANQHNGQVKISNTHGPVAEIFKLTRLHHVFQIQ